MSDRLISAESLRRFVEKAFVQAGYSQSQAVDAANVLLWASLRGVDSHGVRNLKSYYIDRTLSGQINPVAKLRIEHQTPNTACLDGKSGLGLACACDAMRLAIDKSSRSGVGIVGVRNTHHLGPAGYFAHMAVEQGMLGACATGHFFGTGHGIGIAPLGSIMPMFSTNPLSFAAPCGRHPPFVLDMSTAVTTVNRIEMHAQAGQPIPAGWARDASGNPTTDANLARVLMPLGGTMEQGAHKGVGLALMVSILSGVLSGAWARVESVAIDEAPSARSSDRYDQPNMGHIFAAMRVDAFQSNETFQQGMDAMIDALHATPTIDPSQRVCFPGERESAIAAERARDGIPISDYIFTELQALAKELALEQFT